MADLKVNGPLKTDGRLHRAAGGLAASSVVFAAPFTASASCVLSEDYFLTSQVIMNTGDVVRPFARADGSVEALVLSGGVVSHLSRSPADTSGWSLTALPGTGQFPMTGVVDIAVGTGTDGTVWALALRNINDPSSSIFNWATLGSSGAWEYPGDMLIAAGLDRLQSGVDRAGNVYFYAFFTSSKSSEHPNGSFVLWQPPSSMLGSFNASLAGLDIVDARLLWNPEYSASNYAGGVLGLGSSHAATWYAQTSSTGFDRSGPDLADDVAVLLWVSWSADPTNNGPTFVVQDTAGTVWYTDNQRPDPVDLAVFPPGVFPSVGGDQVATWFKDDLASFAMLVGGTVNILAQYGNPAYDVQFTPPIPIERDIMSVWGLPADPDQATLFVTYDDATLYVLTKSPVVDAGTGVTADVWMSVPVHQASATVQELDCWRVQLTMTDANGVSMPGTDLAITSDQPLGVWQASGNTILGSASPATMTTDSFGRVTFAYPAIELDTASLSVQVMQDGTLSGDPLTVHPDGDAQAFLAGTAPLNDIGTLTTSATSGSTALLQARNSVGQPLFPVLTSLSGTDQVTASNGVASAISQAMLAGQGIRPGTSDPQSFLLDMSGPVPAYTSSTSPAGVSAGLKSSGWWDSVKHDAESAYHGIRRGVIKVEKCAGTWAEDADQWTLDLAITIGDDISDVVAIVVTDVRSAIHAISGIFQALGADIEEAITWLRLNVGELITQAGQNAKLAEGWLNQLPGIASQQLAKFGNLAEGFFYGLEATVDHDIQALLTELEKLTFGNPLPPVSQRGVRGAESAAFDIESFLNSVQHNWLLDKIISFYSGDTQAAQNSELQGALDQLGAALQDAWQFLENIGDLVWTGLKDLFASRGSFDDTTFAQLFTLLQSTVNDLLNFADAMVQALVKLAEAAMDQLGSMLSHQINEIPVVGGLLRLFGVDDTMSIAHLTCLVLMYPATLANRIKNGTGTPMFPAAGQHLSAAQLDWAAGLQISAAVGQGIWGAADAVADTYRAGGQEPSGMIGWIDIVAPVILNILQWPGAPNADGSTAPPFVNSIDSSGHDGLLILPTWLLGWVPPIAGLCGQFADYQPPVSQAPEAAEGGEDWPEIGQYFTMVSAIGATITGSIYNFGTAQTSNVQAAGILGNISNIIAPFATKEIAESTEYISEVIKLMVDLAGNVGAAVAMGT